MAQIAATSRAALAFLGESRGDEVRDRELAELADVRREEQRQDDVAARPAHHVRQTVVAEEPDGCPPSR